MRAGIGQKVTRRAPVRFGPGVRSRHFRNRHRQHEQEEERPGQRDDHHRNPPIVDPGEPGRQRIRRPREPLQQGATKRHAEPRAEQRAAVKDEVRGVALPLGEQVGDQRENDRREPRLADRDTDRRHEQATETVLERAEPSRERPAGDAERKDQAAAEAIGEPAHRITRNAGEYSHPQPLQHTELPVAETQRGL